MLLLIPSGEYYSHYITLDNIGGSRPASSSKLTIYVRHGDGHFDEVRVFLVICSGVAQLCREWFSAHSSHLTRLTHTFLRQKIKPETKAQTANQSKNGSSMCMSLFWKRKNRFGDFYTNDCYQVR